MISIHSRCRSYIDQIILPRRDELRIQVNQTESGATIIDFGIDVAGGLAAGVALAEICMGTICKVQIDSFDRSKWNQCAVSVQTDHPLLACLGSQYAGWPVSVGKYFAMGSGPMRLLRGREAVLEHLQLSEKSEFAVGVLETRKIPSDEVCKQIASECNVSVDKLTLCVAPTGSLAGSCQVVARSIETSLHKLHELHFPMEKIVSAFGSAPLPPISKNDLQGIGWTNDAILYGGMVTLWVNATDAELQSVGPKVPSNASEDHGEPFAKIFAKYDHDFYKIDPMLFSPAVVRFHNLQTGSTFEFGNLEPGTLRQSFGNSFAR